MLKYSKGHYWGPRPRIIYEEGGLLESHGSWEEMRMKYFLRNEAPVDQSLLSSQENCFYEEKKHEDFRQDDKLNHHLDVNYPDDNGIR